jgi:diguanylate cyclase (GGDEF)-like protein
MKGLGCELGQGFYFAQALPVEEATRAIGRGFRTGLSRPSLRPPGSVRKSRGRVLLVDDDPPSRRAMRELLAAEEFEVVTANGADECLGRANEAHPEVILLNLRVPAASIETCRRLKDASGTTNIPVLFVTSSGDGDPVALEALSAGVNDFLSKNASAPLLCARLSSQIEISRAQAKLHRLAMTDELTGVFSRRFLFDSLRRAVKGASRAGETGIVCLLVDVDHLKRINDTLGHAEGDRVLAKIAQTIDGHTRDTDVVARFGGEEFVVLLTGTDLRGATIVAEKIRTAVANGCGTTISVGGAWLESAPVELLKSKGEVDKLMDRLLQQADVALSDAKRAGRDCVEICYEPVTPLTDWAPTSQTSARASFE